MALPPWPLHIYHAPQIATMMTMLRHTLRKQSTSKRRFFCKPEHNVSICVNLRNQREKVSYGKGSRRYR